MRLRVSFTDFWQGHDPKNNIISNCIRDIFNDEIDITDPAEADVVFVTVYGNSHRSILEEHHKKSILWLGENLRPNTYNCRYSISFDFNSYGGRNFRLPLWMSEIDWYDTGLGVISMRSLPSVLLEPGDYSLDDIEKREFCITVFNNPEGTRLETLRVLNQFGKVTGYGRPFGNWFPTYESYKAKLELMGKYLFNLCPENSYYPGYYTEKCIHAKIAGCIPIYMADRYVRFDFRPTSFINVDDYQFDGSFQIYFEHLVNDKIAIQSILNQPLLYRLPTLDPFREFLYSTINKILIDF